MDPRSYRNCNRFLFEVVQVSLSHGIDKMQVSIYEMFREVMVPCLMWLLTTLLITCVNKYLIFDLTIWLCIRVTGCMVIWCVVLREEYVRDWHIQGFVEHLRPHIMRLSRSVKVGFFAKAFALSLFGFEFGFDFWFRVRVWLLDSIRNQICGTTRDILANPGSTWEPTTLHPADNTQRVSRP